MNYLNKDKRKEKCQKMAEIFNLHRLEIINIKTQDLVSLLDRLIPAPCIQFLAKQKILTYTKGEVRGGIANMYNYEIDRDIDASIFEAYYIEQAVYTKKAKEKAKEKQKIIGLQRKEINNIKLEYHNKLTRTTEKLNEKIRILEAINSNNTNEKYKKYANRLKEILENNNKIHYHENSINKWAVDIKKLCEIDGVERFRVTKALNWYEDNIGAAYVPVIESGGSLRQKFIKLENAMIRDSQRVSSKYKPIYTKPIKPIKPEKQSEENEFSSEKIIIELLSKKVEHKIIQFIIPLLPR